MLLEFRRIPKGIWLNVKCCSECFWIQSAKFQIGEEYLYWCTNKFTYSGSWIFHNINICPNCGSKYQESTKVARLNDNSRWYLPWTWNSYSWELREKPVPEGALTIAK